MASKGKGIADDYDSSKRKRYEDDDGSSRRKRQNPAVLQFFEDSACEVDESGSSDDDDFFDNLFPEEAFFPVKTEAAKTPDLPLFPKEEEMSEEELEKMLDERYKPGSSYVTYAEDRFNSNRPQESNIFMPSAVPSSKEPTIWKVKCMVGRERHSAFCLMQKYVDLHTLGTKLHIISAFAVEHIKSYIYIEADKQSDINEACKGICSIYPSRAAPVTPSEVPNLFSVRSKCSGIAVDTWARVKNGKYKGDLAQVVAVNESQRKATVKLIPRIDLQAMAEKFGGGVKGKRVATPAPRLISSSELEDFRPLIQYRRDRDTGNIYEIFDGMMLKDGYLFKKVSLDSLSFWGVAPSQAELLRFEPPKDKESDDVEWLTGLFGERKKKKIIQNDKGGGKGESSSSSIMQDGFEVSDLVFHGRNGFGIVIGTEKDDKLRVLKEGSDKPVVVSAEPRLLKKASFEKKFTAVDQQKKTISINDTVRVLEGPLEDRQGIVKQIYKGIIFLHDEIEQENGGYFCAKAQICEKVEIFGDACKGKGGKADTSGFDGLSSSPKSPLSPQKPWEEGKENNRSFNREDKDGFSVGQSLRIRVGPLKGYLCRVLAIRYSDVTVKLDSQQKILTVKSEHLAEVRGKATGVSLGEEPDSAKPFDLIGSDASQSWMNGGAAATEGGGWNTGGPSTERNSSWAPFPSSSLSLNAESNANAFNSLDTDLNKDVGASAWDTKVTPSQGSAWGASVAEEKAVVNTEEVGGWGKTTSNVGVGTSGASSWGKAVSNDIQTDSSIDARDNWGRASTDTSKGVMSSWGKNSASNNEDSGWRKPEEPSDKGKSILGTPPSSSWGKTDAEKNPVDSWGKGTGGRNGQATWGSAVEPSNEGPGEDSWGKAADTLINIHGSSGSKSAWNSASVPASQTGGWGNKGGNAAQSNIEASGWEKGGASSGVQTDKWVSTKNDGEDTKGGWGKGGFGSQGQSDSWGRTASDAGGGSSWSNKKSQKEGEEATAWGKQGNSEGWNKAKTFGADGGSADGGSSWTKEEGGSSWNKQGGGSSWSNQDGGSSWGKPSGGSSWSGQADGTADKQSWQRTNDFGSDRGGSGGRRGGRGGRGDRGGRNGGGDRSVGQGECFKCGLSGHFARECPSSGGGDKSAGQGDCFKCGLSGHFARECPSSGGGDRSAAHGDCFKCGVSGHRARDCPSSGGGDRSAGQGDCFKCGVSGHFARECPSSGGGDRSAGQGDCFKCGVSGHRARECPSSGGGDRPGGHGDCFKCGVSGHFARECPSSGDGQSGGGRGGRSFDRDGSSGGWSKGQGSYGGTSTGGNKFSNWSSGQASGGWGGSNKDSNVGTTGWKNYGDETGKWGSTKEEGDRTTAGGWGKGGSDSWSKLKDSGGDGGSSWNNNNNNQGDSCGSSWNKHDASGSAWSKPTWNNDNKDDDSNRTFEGGHGSGGRSGRGGGRGGGRDNYGRGGGRSSSGQWGEQSSSWKGGNSSGQAAGGWGNSKPSDGNKCDDLKSTGWKKDVAQTTPGNASGWGNISTQATAGGWGSSKLAEGNKKDDQTTTDTGNISGWGANSGQTETGGGWGSGMKTFGGKKDDAEGSGGWKKSEGGTVDQAGSWGNSNAGKKDDGEGSGWKKDQGNQAGNWGAKKDDQGAAGWGKGTGNWS